MENTLIFGNGINRLSHSNISWEKILDEIKQRKFNNDNLPNTMIYERIVMERPDLDRIIFKVEAEIKKLIASKLETLQTHTLYNDIFNLKMNNYLTTNYDYSFKNTLVTDKSLSFENLSNEDIYSIRRKISILKNNKDISQIWHIHGEIQKPNTIMLGLDHYCGAIGKINNYVKGNYEYQENGNTKKLVSIKEKLLNNSFDKVSWVELFFTSNIHILALSLDYSETDLWWVLNKRARMLRDREISYKIKNKIIYYCNQIEKSKEELLRSFKVDVEIIPLINNNEWDRNYSDIIRKIKNS